MMSPTVSALQQPPIQYNSTISGKGALIAETQLILERVAALTSLADVRMEVLNENLLSKETSSTRENIWKNISQRYFAGRSDTAIQTLAHVVASPLSSQARYLILFYNFAQIDRLLYDFVADCLYQLYPAGRSSVEKVDILKWLDAKLRDGHTEITSWSPQTRSKVVSNLLSIVRDFGLLQGGQRKTFRRLYVPLSAFLYVLYDLQDSGLAGRQLVEAEALRLFLLDHDDVLLLLGEAARKGLVTLRYAGDIYDLKLHHNNLLEALGSAGTEIS